MRFYLLLSFFLYLYLFFCNSIHAKTIDDNLHKKNDLSINLTRLICYENYEIMYRHTINSRTDLRFGINYHEGRGSKVTSHNILFSTFTNFSKVSNIYEGSLGLDIILPSFKKHERYFSTDLRFQRSEFSNILYNNGSGMTMDEVKKIMSGNSNIISIRVLRGKRIYIPKDISLNKFVIDYFWGVSFGINFTKQILDAQQNSNDPWIYYKPAQITTNTSPYLNFHLGIKIGVDW